MNKQQLVEAVAQELQSSKADAKRAVNAFFKSVEDGLQKDHNVHLDDLGYFDFKKLRWKSILPRPKDFVPKWKIVFKVGKTLKESLNRYNKATDPEQFGKVDDITTPTPPPPPPSAWCEDTN